MYWRDVTWKWTLDTVDLRYYSEQPIHPPSFLIITHIFWDTFTSHGDKPSCIEETTYNLCFGDPLCRRLQKLVGNNKPVLGVCVETKIFLFRPLEEQRNFKMYAKRDSKAASIFPPLGIECSRCAHRWDVLLCSEESTAWVTDKNFGSLPLQTLVYNDLSERHQELLVILGIRTCLLNLPTFER